MELINSTRDPTLFSVDTSSAITSTKNSILLMANATLSARRVKKEFKERLTADLLAFQALLTKANTTTNATRFATQIQSTLMAPTADLSTTAID